MNITIQRNHYNAVIASTAKDDIRYYLRGFYLDADRMVAVGTDGHGLVTVPIEGDIVSSVILSKTKPIPKKVGESIIIELTDPVDPPAEYRLIAGDTIHVLEPIDAKYPDWKSVMPEPNGTVPGIAINPELITRVTKALGVEFSKLLFTDITSSIGVEFPKEPDVACVVMPARF